MVDAFFLETPKGYRKNALAVAPAKGNTGKKGYTFHRTVKIKQPHTITEPTKKGRSQILPFSFSVP